MAGVKLKVRLVHDNAPQGLTHHSVEFCPVVAPEKADGMLCWGPPTDEFLFYPGPKRWYWPEARSHNWRRSQVFKRTLRHLTHAQFLHHSNPDPCFRFPCPTHYHPMYIPPRAEKTHDTVAIVSNLSGGFWWLWKWAARRNVFILNQHIDLYGNPRVWNNFKRYPWSARRAPANYREGWPSEWFRPEHVDLLATYRFAVCLENSCEPHYFTEKFVNAARASCVPIYHAHPTVRDGILQGAVWIDPEDYDFDSDDTLDAAHEADADQIVEQNLAWLQSPAVRATDGLRIWSQIADTFTQTFVCWRPSVNGERRR
jgi:hypothetical protein